MLANIPRKAQINKSEKMASLRRAECVIEMDGRKRKRMKEPGKAWLKWWVPSFGACQGINCLVGLCFVDCDFASLGKRWVRKGRECVFKSAKALGLHKLNETNIKKPSHYPPGLLSPMFSLIRQLTTCLTSYQTTQDGQRIDIGSDPEGPNQITKTQSQAAERIENKT